MSKPEEGLRAALLAAGVPFLWQGDQAQIDKLDYKDLYGVAKWAEPDFYLPKTSVFIEVKGQMTLHQVSKMLYLAGRHPYYVYQHTEEDWDPTIRALVEVTAPPPKSSQEAARKRYNQAFQKRELCHIAANAAAAAYVGEATYFRLRAYVAFFESHLRAATKRGLLE